MAFLKKLLILPLDGYFKINFFPYFFRMWSRRDREITSSWKIDKKIKDKFIEEKKLN